MTEAMDMGSELLDPGAEGTLLAAVMDQPHLMKLFADLPPDLFGTPINRSIRDTIVGLYEDEQPFDHSSVVRRLERHTSSRAQAQGAQSRVFGMMGKGQNIHASPHIDRLVALMRARATNNAAQRLAFRVTESVRMDEPGVLDEGLIEAIAHLQDLESDAGLPGDQEPPLSLDALLAELDTFDWLIPGLLERMDRLILTGYEGTGKSYLLAQIALTICAGLHPFLGRAVAGHRRVLVVDSENSKRQTRRRYRKIKKMVEDMCRKEDQEIPDWSQLFRFVIRPEGIELNDPLQMRRIEGAIIAQQPDLVIIGPLYRLHKLNTQDEDAAKELVRLLDYLRVKHNFTLLSEAHVNHGGGYGKDRGLRPTGSSVFMRWPEFGLGLKPASGTEDQEHPNKVDLVAWRGGREERFWPATLHHNFRDLPWMADDAYELRLQSNGFLD